MNKEPTDIFEKKNLTIIEALNLAMSIHKQVLNKEIPEPETMICAFRDIEDSPIFEFEPSEDSYGYNGRNIEIEVEVGQSMSADNPYGWSKTENRVVPEEHLTPEDIVSVDWVVYYSYTEV